MSLRYTEIPRRLQEIDSATYQLLVNQYLRWNDPNIVGVSPNGSHDYKLKTTTGQPDAHFHLSDGRQLWAEHTTTDKRAVTVRKFKGDIDGCKEERRSRGLTPEDIRELKLCYTVNLSADQEQELINYGRQRGFNITLLGLATLAMDLDNKYPRLAEVFLSITMGTGQLFAVDDFVKTKKNYSGGIATPLDNLFVGRREEVGKLKVMMQQVPVVCIVGASGVGKTRLGLQTLEELSELDGKPVFVLEDNGQNVHEDLHGWFDGLYSGYLLIEDANRHVNNLKQAVQYLKRYSDKDIRLVLTVRSYAREAVQRALAEVNCDWLEVGVASDDDIRQILTDAPYLLSEDQRWDIARLVKGNVRFALMAARLLNDKEATELPNSLLNLFDLYFKTYVSDFAELLTPDYTKTLGLLSMLQAIDLTPQNTDELSTILQDFQVTGSSFTRCIQELQRRELVTRRFDMVILNEQVFSTYFFYLAFIKTKGLDFSMAMRYERERRHINKVSEHLNEIGQRFGDDVVLEAIKPNLLNRESQLTTAKERFTYLHTYWRFRPAQTLSLLNTYIKRCSAG